MLDLEIKDQLKTVFSTLEHDVQLVYSPSNHNDQSELLELLNDVASVSEKIKLVSGQTHPQSAHGPCFHIEANGQKTGISFRGIPTGHEFTSLILAILNSDGKGKMPDANLRHRIQRLKGPIRLKTYISLTCENCPDVVQALNLMALIHADFQHEMIDGAYAQGEIEALAIQGVPSIVAGAKLIHSGRIHPLDLVQKLEEQFGTTESSSEHTPTHLGDYDVAILGGGPAGVSAAIYSARKGLSTALIAERMGGQVQDTRGIENLISVIYTEGPKLAAQMHEHLASYPVTMIEGRRVANLDKITKTIHLEGGDTVKAKAIVIATGAKWRELGVPGEKEYLGRGVAYCPHCDGPFYKGKKVAVIGGGNSGVEAAIDLAGIVKEVVLLEYADQLKADQVLVDKVHSLANVTVITSAKTMNIAGDGQKVTHLKYEDRKTSTVQQLDLDGVFVQIGLLPNSSFAKEAVETSKFGEIIVDAKGRTSAPGIYAAGDVTTTPYKQIIIAMGEGAKVALSAFEDRMREAAG